MAPAGMAPRRLYRVLAIAATVCIAGLTVVALRYALHEISYRDLIGSLTAMRGTTLAAALAATVASFVVALANDFVALRYAAPARRSFRPFWRRSAAMHFGNFVGFGMLSGGAVRYRFYAAVGVSRRKIASVTIFIIVAFGVGAIATIALGLALRAHEIAQLYALPYELLHLVAVFIAATPLAFLLGRLLGWRNIRLGSMTIELPSVRLAVFQIAVTIIEIVFAAIVLWVLLPLSGVDFPAFVAIYAAALLLGFVSHAPGGIGVFEAVVLYTVGMRSEPSEVAAALVAYRAVYFLLPVVLAALLLATFELRRWRKKRGSVPAARAKTRHGCAN